MQNGNAIQEVYFETSLQFVQRDVPTENIFGLQRNVALPCTIHADLAANHAVGTASTLLAKSECAYGSTTGFAVIMLNQI